MDSEFDGKTVSTGASQTAPPVISLPKGGGAIRGIGEKFAATPVSGTGSFSVPIATSPGRSGFGPQLALSYDSGGGNGPFGFGWNFSLPTLTRKTDKGLPQYLDHLDSDTFILSGTEDLVPQYRQDHDGSWLAANPGYQRDTSEFWVRDQSGRLVIHEDDVEGYRVRRYRPRIEGLFARIERWSKIGSPEDVHWRSLSRDNILTLFGLDPKSRIADPLNAARIFSWLISETRDDKGNAVIYEYKPEDGIGVNLDQAHEQNRGLLDDQKRKANRYLKRIYYGNRIPLLDNIGGRPRFLDQNQINLADWMFEVVFDYGDHDQTTPNNDDERADDGAGSLKYPWKHRTDSFSTYRSGFEVRTSRVCHRVLMFHHFPGETGVERNCLVRSTDFTYSSETAPSDVRNPVYTFLTQVRQTGYRRNNVGYDQKSLPPVEFEYSKPVVQNVVEEIDPESLQNLPIGLNGNTYQWTDLHGEGIPGFLTEQGDSWFYKRNLSPIPEILADGSYEVKARFGKLEAVAFKPNVSLRQGAALMDLAGDGQPDVVLFDGTTPGLYEHDEAESWQPFRPFTSRLNRDLRDANVKFIDLDGDGRADVLITDDDAFVWHVSRGEEGFGPAKRVMQTLDEEKGPRVVFSDVTQSIYLADLSGDGLTDIVRVRNGEVCYWPNLGFGQFGAKVAMDNPPWFDHSDQFDHERIRLADIDGSGTTDIIYLHHDEVRIYFNQSGNSWSEPVSLQGFPRIDDLASIETIDLLGNGTACLVWSSSLPGDVRRPMRYVNLMGNRKPHLLVKTTNNLGAEIRIDYAPSTKFYLQDKRDGKPWITRLPFPVHVVERVETYDYVSRNRFVTRYAYHHGYFDGEEREFRGFGMVEQWDTEAFATFEPGTLSASNIAAEYHVPPVHTKTWFHTGVYTGREHISDFFAGLKGERDEDEYFREPGLTDAEARELLLPDTILRAGLSAEEEYEACRALKGSMLRQEIYADDIGPGASAEQIYRSRIPYSVTEKNFRIRLLQARGTNRHAVFLTHTQEEINFHYERNPADPRIQHELTLEVDDYGNVLKQAAVVYGRREQIRVVGTDGSVHRKINPGFSALHDADRAKQTTALLTYTEDRMTNGLHLVDTHRNPLPCEAITFELNGYVPTGPGGRYRAEDFVETDPASSNLIRHKFAHQIPYEAVPTDPECRRPIEWVRTLYRRDDLTGLLPLSSLDSRALPGESYRLAFTPGLLAGIFRRPRDGQQTEPLIPVLTAVLGGQADNQGGYLQSQTLKNDGRFPASDPDDHWWIPSGRVFFTFDIADSPLTEQTLGRQHFFLPSRYRDPFGQNTFVFFDANDLLIVETRDALENRVIAESNDYRVLQPRVLVDPNRNRTEVVFDALGMVAATAVMGKPQPAPVEGDSVASIVTDFEQSDLDLFFDAADPHIHAPSLLRDATTRIIYDLDRFRRTQLANPDEPSRWLPSWTATLERDTHVSAALPPQGVGIRLSFGYTDGFGREIQKKVQAEPGPLVAGGPVVDPRWVAGGWTIFNVKGMPIRQYEPFFGDKHNFEWGVQVGVGALLFYDPAERVVATLHPNNTYEKVVFDPWQQTSYDVNDTCALKNAETGDPRNDPHIASYVRAYFDALPADPPGPWRTWHQRRVTGELGTQEREAAHRAEAHADTPTTTHFDALGRPFLTVTRNRVVCPGHDLDGTDDSIHTRVELDIEGNQRAVRDAVKRAGDPLGRIVMQYEYDMLGNRLYQLSMEAGARWILNDVTGKPIRSWDSRGHNFTSSYDKLRRPFGQTIRGTTADSDPRTLNRDILIEKFEYGEDLDNAESLNLRARVYRHFDSAGVITYAGLDANGDPREALDFKGNLLHSTRRLVTDYTAIPDWGSNPLLDPEGFESSAKYDALNRAVQLVVPHSALPQAKCSVIQPVFNEANLLERIDVWLERSTEPAEMLEPTAEAASPVGVTNIDYNAKGQRERIDYKNGASTSYRYDPETFRLTQLYTRRGSSFIEDCENSMPPPATIAAPDSPLPGKHCGIQNLHYTYDPVGNISSIRDEAQQTIFFRNAQIEPSNDYVYDAVYRLIQATGREHLGQVGGSPVPHSYNDAPRVGIDWSSNDGNAMGRYCENFVYDEVGNFLKMIHRRSCPGAASWIRSYEYNESSQTENGKLSNRLTSTTIGSATDIYSSNGDGYDPHGNMRRMPQLQSMRWNFRDQLAMTSRQAVNSEDAEGIERQGERTWYVYDSGGQRVRKVTEFGSGQIKDERIYLGGLEIYRRHGVNAVTRETLNVMDDKQRIAMVETRTQGSGPGPVKSIRYQLSNHLDSSSLELDEHAQIVSYEEYTPYGSTAYQAVRSATETPKRYCYTGMERDEESGLNYHSARYYSTCLGRWTRCDPIMLDGGLNLFSYCSGNPILKRDVLGTDEWCGFSDGFFGLVSSECHVVPEVKQAAAVALSTIEVIVGCGLSETGIAIPVCIDGLDNLASAVTQQPTAKQAIISGTLQLGGASKETADYYGLWGSMIASMAVGASQPIPARAPYAVANAEAKQAAKAEARAAEAEATQVTKAEAKQAGKGEAKQVAKAEGSAQKTVRGSSNPRAGEALVGSSRSQMRREAARIIGKDPNHPLRFLLDKALKFKAQKGLKHAELADRPDIVQMGHIASDKLGGQERLMLQGAWENQLNNISVEASHIGGGVLHQIAIDIGGIAVDLKTATFWESIGWLKSGTVNAAPRISL